MFPFPPQRRWCWWCFVFKDVFSESMWVPPRTSSISCRKAEAPSICRLPICFNRVSNLKLYRVGIQVSEWAGLPYASTDHFWGVVLLQNSEYTSLSLMKPPNAKQERLKDIVPVPVCNLDDSNFPWDRLGRPFSPHRPLEGELISNKHGGMHIQQPTLGPC